MSLLLKDVNINKNSKQSHGTTGWKLAGSLFRLLSLLPLFLSGLLLKLRNT